MKLILYTADCQGNRFNTRYPHRVEATNAAELAKCVENDHVAARYKGFRRGNDNFEEAEAIPMDVDNEHSDDPADWVTPGMLADDPILADVSFATTPSRHNMLPKDGKDPRPRFHVHLQTGIFRDAEKYRALKAAIQQRWPFFDIGALDAGRFMYGTVVSEKDVFWHEGFLNIDDVMLMEEGKAEEPGDGGTEPDGVIREGSRNNAMSVFASKILKKYGVTEEAHGLFLERAGKCEPPLPVGELNSIWKSAVKFARKLQTAPDYVPPERYNNDFVKVESGWEDPLPFGRYEPAPFPVDVLPSAFQEYVLEVAESTQTPRDMAGTASLAVSATCIQKKYVVQGKADWTEPVNIYLDEIAAPSERKSAVLQRMVRPLDAYEKDYNARNSAAIAQNRSMRRALERKQKAVEEMFVKGKATKEELDRIAAEVDGFKDMKPLQLYADDITPEKLVSVLAANGGKMAIISSEGGLFDTFAGSYSNFPHLDPLLKAYSGDTIRVDRMLRDSELVLDPALTILLMTQPKVISDVLKNQNFRRKGLTARFLYTMPRSAVGSRNFESDPVRGETYRRYEQAVGDMLRDRSVRSVITLSPEASERLAAFAGEVESKLTREYAEIADWAGKLVGNTLRLSGILRRMGETVGEGLLAEPLVVDGPTMEGAIRLGKYFLSHALLVHDAVPEDGMVGRAETILRAIRGHEIRELNRREAMRLCPFFKTVGDIQPVLDFLDDYGYIAAADAPQPLGKGRPPLPRYRVNPAVLAKGKA